MPSVRVIFYRKCDGRSWVLDWLDSIPMRARDKCRVRIERLTEVGHELRRPEADYLGEAIYELRAKHLRINYRMLYFFHGRELAVISRGFVKQQTSVPPREIRAAIRDKRNFENDPVRHTHQE